jgi:hypothetical protein
MLSARDGLKNLAAVHRHLLGSLHPEAHLVATYFHNNDCDVVVDADALDFFSRQNQHGPFLGAAKIATCPIGPKRHGMGGWGGEASLTA